MEKSMNKRPAEVDYENLEDYWRAEEKVQLILTGMTAKIPVTTLCKLNNVSPSQCYEWREQFIARGKEGLMTNGGRNRRESQLEVKYRSLKFKRRLQEHNRGDSTYTTDFKPWKMVFVCWLERAKAFKFEKYLKSHSGKAFTAKHF